MTHANTTTPAENPILAYMAVANLGASLSGHRYGVYTLARLPRVFAIAMDTAFFSSVCPSVAATQATLMLLTPYVAPTNSIIAKYRAPMFNVPHATANPTIASNLEIVTCQVLSLKWPDDHETATEVKVARRYGGQVRTRVIVELKPSVSTTVGMKFLNPLAER